MGSGDGDEEFCLSGEIEVNTSSSRLLAEKVDLIFSCTILLCGKIGIAGGGNERRSDLSGKLRLSSGNPCELVVALDISSVYP